MNRSVIDMMFHGALNGTVSFPHVVETLTQAGVESYHVDYLTHENRYYHASGETYALASAHSLPEIAAHLDQERLKAIIRKSQAGEAKYPEFLAESAKAGCVYYIVSLTGKKVTYFGRDGAEHIEHFPGRKL